MSVYVRAREREITSVGATCLHYMDWKRDVGVIPFVDLRQRRHTFRHKQDWLTWSSMCVARGATVTCRATGGALRFADGGAGTSTKSEPPSSSSLLSRSSMYWTGCGALGCFDAWAAWYPPFDAAHQENVSLQYM